jgi:hypothetical protein
MTQTRAFFLCFSFFFCHYFFLLFSDNNDFFLLSNLKVKGTIWNNCFCSCIWYVGIGAAKVSEHELYMIAACLTAGV